MALRSYLVTSNQAKWLQQFQWNNLKVTYGDELLHRMEEHGLFVFPTHAEEWEHNKANILKINKMSPIAQVKALNSGYHASHDSSNKSGGLLDLCRGAKVHLKVNIEIEWDLFNGASGKIIDIIYKEEHRPGGEQLPEIVYVDFPKYSGSTFIATHPM